MLPTEKCYGIASMRFNPLSPHDALEIILHPCTYTYLIFLQLEIS